MSRFDEGKTKYYQLAATVILNLFWAPTAIPFITQLQQPSSFLFQALGLNHEKVAKDQRLEKRSNQILQVSSDVYDCKLVTDSVFVVLLGSDAVLIPKHLETDRTNTSLISVPLVFRHQGRTSKK